MAKIKVKVVKSKDKPVLAEAITEISKGMKKLLGSGLNRTAIVVLLQHNCSRSISQREIKDVLNHRFGFVSQVLAGSMVQNEFELHADEFAGNVNKWTASGNRPLVQELDENEDGEVVAKRYRLSDIGKRVINAGGGYGMQPGKLHRVDVITFPLVTIMTKTYEATILCPKDKVPDQDYDRFQIPWEHIAPALVHTQFGRILPALFDFGDQL